MQEQDPNCAQISKNSNPKTDPNSLAELRLNWGLKATISTLIYKKLKQLRVELHGLTSARVRSSIQRPKPSINMARSFEFRPKFAPNLHQLVGVVEWGNFIAKSGKNSLGLGAWVAHAW